ncbi:polysaccharide export outer membrane protein [Saccharicrinis carchari]|uniref:Polysaccharide export outer membrane protein n=1 Tax=Saccharicrinis carchari TaxID=1168039 RepID=A0A521BRU6_SACCC|nr:polysaccharide biosynthesis/export family protein [Saccharicrinis carchari]SMO49887.1 polysaccharide export outer membrane protein [Saccharicrinis carchari]
MKTKQILFYIAMVLFLGLSSCVSRKKMTYLKYSGALSKVDPSSFDGRKMVKPSEYKIMPYDNLFINVSSLDPKWSSMFNTASEGSLTEESAILQGYLVDIEGNIEIPFIGKVRVMGETLEQIKTKLESTFSSYVKDASITVRLVNNHVSVIGEVMTPGKYQLTKVRVNIFEALAMAGDLSSYGNRTKIQLIRPTPYGPVVKEFSLGDRSILNSEFYYVMPNDIIYAPPLKGKSFQVNSSVFAILISVANAGLVVFALLNTSN